MDLFTSPDIDVSDIQRPGEVPSLIVGVVSGGKEATGTLTRSEAARLRDALTEWLGGAP